MDNPCIALVYEDLNFKSQTISIKQETNELFDINQQEWSTTKTMLKIHGKRRHFKRQGTLHECKKTCLQSFQQDWLKQACTATDNVSI